MVIYQNNSSYHDFYLWQELTLLCSCFLLPLVLLLWLQLSLLSVLKEQNMVKLLHHYYAHENTVCDSKFWEAAGIMLCATVIVLLN